MGLVALFSTAFLVGLSGAMMPGPMLSITLERTSRLGWVAGPVVVLGHSLLELVLVVCLAMGLEAIISSELFAGTVAILGGIVLVWMGLGIVKNAGQTMLPSHSQNQGDYGPVAIKVWVKASLGGLTTSLGNPYWVLWWGTVGASYVTFALKSNGFIGLSAFFGGHILSDFVWYTCASAAMTAGRRWLPRSFYVGTLRLLGVFLVAFALYFIRSGIGILFS